MPEPELFLLFVRPLNRAGIRYVVTGGQLDRPALNEWIRRCGLQTEWRLVSENPGGSRP